MRWLIPACLVVGSAMACGSEFRAEECKAGGPTCPCVQPDACDPGLECRSGVCVDLGEGGGDGDAHTAAPGAGGDSAGGAPGETSGGVASLGGVDGGGSAGRPTGGVAGGGTAGRGGDGGASGEGAVGGLAMGGGGSDLLFFDDFEGGSAPRWTPTYAGVDWSIASDGSFVYKEGTLTSTSWDAAVAGDVGWTDFALEARVKVLDFVGSSSAYYAAVCARVVQDERICLALCKNGSTQLLIKTPSNPGFASANTVPIIASVWYRVRLEVRGESIKGYVNDTLMISETNAAIAAGRIAIGTSGAAAEFDDVRVTALP